MTQDHQGPRNELWSLKLVGASMMFDLESSQYDCLNSLGHSTLIAVVLDLDLKSIDKPRKRQCHLCPLFGFHWLYHIP